MKSSGGVKLVFNVESSLNRFPDSILHVTSDSMLPVEILNRNAIEKLRSRGKSEVLSQSLGQPVITARL